MSLFATILLHILASTAVIYGVDIAGYKPSVAIRCDRVPFYVDLSSGEWRLDADGLEICDENKEVVKKYCQKMYPNLDITNIVEANQPEQFINWCSSGEKQCTEVKSVVPYRCLVNEYEADVIWIPDGCTYHKIQDFDKCLSHTDWATKARKSCKETYSMILKDNAVILPCGTDKFNGIEFSCCRTQIQEEIMQPMKDKAKDKTAWHNISLDMAIKDFMTYLPTAVADCDARIYLDKEVVIEKNHFFQVAALVGKWEDTEKKFKQPGDKDSDSPQDTMKDTLMFLKEHLAALEKDLHNHQTNIQLAAADCNRNRTRNHTRAAMFNLISVIHQSSTTNQQLRIATRDIMRVFEEDRENTFRRMGNVASANSSVDEEVGKNILEHLENLNKIVNATIILLSRYKPKYEHGLETWFDIPQESALEPAIDETHSHPKLESIFQEYEYFFNVMEEAQEEFDNDDTAMDEEESLKVEEKQTESEDGNIDDDIIYTELMKAALGNKTDSDVDWKSGENITDEDILFTDIFKGELAIDGSGENQKTHKDAREPDKTLEFTVLISEFNDLVPSISTQDCEDYDKDKADFRANYRKQMKELAKRYEKTEQAFYEETYFKDQLIAENRFKENIYAMQNTLKQIEEKSQIEEKGFWKKHGNCLGVHVFTEKRKAMRSYVTSLLAKDLDDCAKIISAYQLLQETLRHEQIYKCSQKNTVQKRTHSSGARTSIVSECLEILDKGVELLLYLPMDEIKRLELVKKVKNIRYKTTCEC